MTKNNQKGLLTELNCEICFTKRNILLSKPISQDSKYDYIMEYKCRLYKIQCKSATFKNDKIIFRTRMNNIRQNTTKYYSDNDVDFFYTYYNGVSYLIPFNKSGKGETTLRFASDTPENSSIKWAKDYEVDKILSKIEIQEKVV